MRPKALTALAAVVLAGAAPVALAAQPTTLGTGAKTCVLNPGTSCKGVTHHRASLAGRDLHGARFYDARMHHAEVKTGAFPGGSTNRVRRSHG